MERRVRRLQRLREHHRRCAEKQKETAAEKYGKAQETTLQLMEMMNRKKEKKKEQQELESCSTDGSLSVSSQDFGSEYAPSSLDTSEDEESCHEPSIQKKGEVFREPTSTVKSLAHVDEDLCDEDNSRSGITVKTCTKGQNRVWDKRHYCVYCKKPQSKMSRHLLRKHNNQKEVALVVGLPPKSKKRRKTLEQLRRKGNYFHNIEVLQKGQGEIVTYRQPSEHADPKDYLPCSICFGFYLKDLLWKHEKMCRKTAGESEHMSKKKRRVQAAASSLLPIMGQLSQRCINIVNRMAIDEVSLEVRNDPLICEFGERLLEKHGGDHSRDGHVSQKMRELGRFVIAAKSLDNKVKMLKDILVPPNFSLAVKAAKTASGFLKSKYRYATPSLAIKLGHSLKAVCDIVIGQYIKAEDGAAAGRVKNFLDLIASEWDLYVSRRARTNLEEDRWNKKEMIPLTEDVMKLHKVLKNTEAKAKQKLMEGPNPTAYKTLSECLLSQVILFNRRRQGEAAKLPLLTFTERTTEEPNEDIMQGLSKLERDLSHEFTRLVIRGKRGKRVPVLLTKEMTKSLDFLIERRSEENNILDCNDYVFARQNSESHIRGSDCLRKYAAASGAKRPETLTSTHLRKHVATLSQIMNLKENELDQLAKFMGHDIRVHREYYRLTENTLQLAKISKLLMAVELGTDVYRGKSLDEIDLDLENALSSKVGGVEDSHVDASDTEVFSQMSWEQAQGSNDGPNSLNESTSTLPPPNKRKRTRKTGSSTGKCTETIRSPQDSEEEADILTPRTSTSQPSKKGKTRSFTGKCIETIRSPQDSEEEADILRRKTLTSRPSKAFKMSEKRGSSKKIMSKRVLESLEDTHGPCTEKKSRSVLDSDEDSNAVNLHLQSRTKGHRRPWHQEEKAAVWRQLGQFITLQRVPGKELCLKALEAEPALSNRSWKDVKNQVYNSITSQKRKQL